MVALVDPLRTPFDPMARQEQDREDLLREATALVERVELKVAGEPDAVTAGFRRDGAASVYFGPDPVYQFNRAGELRRAFRNGKLLKADAGALVELTRTRSPTATTLVRRDLDAAETAQLLEEMRARLERLSAALRRGEYRVIGHVPPEADVVGRLGRTLETLCDRCVAASSPRAR